MSCSHRGRRLRPQDLGVLASIQVAHIPVYRRPTVALIITGNELVRGRQPLTGCQIVDSNSLTLAGLSRRLGAVPVRKGIIGDDYHMIKEAIQKATEDVVIITGGTGRRRGLRPAHHPRTRRTRGARRGDAAVESSGVWLHPAAADFPHPRQPGLSSGGLRCLRRPDAAAPAGPAARYPYAKVRGILTRKIASGHRPCRFRPRAPHRAGVEPLRVTGASILSSTTRADGFVIVDKNSEGLDEGQEVEVYVYS